MLKTEDKFFEDLGKRESSGNYRAKNKQGFIGKYQMGEYAMIDAGYYKKNSKIGNNDWSGQFTGKDGVYSVEDFLNNKQAQENAQKAFKQAQWSYLKNIGATKYLGQIINGIKITPAALLGGAHIGGQGKVNDFVRSGGKIDGKDENGVPVSEYMRRFQDYDVSGITGLKFDNASENIDQQSVVTQEPHETNSVPTPNNINSNTNNALFKLFAEYNDYQQNNLPNLNDLMVNPIEQQIQKINPWDIIPMAIPESLRQPSGVPTGQAANFDINQLANILGIQLPEVQPTNQPQQNSGLFGYANPLTGSNHIYTREEVGQMSSDEFAKHEKEIDAQTRAFNGTMPTNGDLQREAMAGGGVVYVNSYTRSDGTKIKGYYRSRPRF